MSRTILHILAAAAALFVAGCDAKSEGVPVDNPDRLIAIGRQLSPWIDGSPNRSHDGRTPPERGSDRDLFGTWLQRYYDHRQYDQHLRGYVPQKVPATVGEVIDEQRAVNARTLAADATKRAEVIEQQRQQADRERAGQLRSEQHWAAEEATMRASQVQSAATARAERIGREARDAARQKCLDDRQMAALSADAADYQRVWNSFPACERMP